MYTCILFEGSSRVTSTPERSKPKDKFSQVSVYYDIPKDKFSQVSVYYDIPKGIFMIFG